MIVAKRFGVALATLLLLLTMVGCATGATPSLPDASGTPGAVTTDTTTLTDTASVPTDTGVLTDTPATTPTPLPPAPELSDSATTTDSGLRYEDTVPGDGDEVATGDVVVIDYTGYLTDGQVIDSSIDRGEPYTFTVGAGRSLEGLDEGMVGMQVGGERLLEIPGALAYGDQGAGIVPPNATLIFRVNLLSVTAAPQPTSVDSYETTENGVEYAILTEGEGDPVVVNDLVTFNFNAWRGDGVLFDSSYQVGRPAQFVLGQSGLPGLDEGLAGMKKGETRQIRIPPEQAYGAEGAGTVIPPNDTITFEVELVDVVVSPKLTVAPDSEYTTTDSGLQYAIIQEGTGDEVAEAGDGVSVHYSGFLEDGTLFDSSVQRDQPFIFTLGTGQVIPGWEEGIAGMKKGEIRQLRIPGDLAYGEMGSPPLIPANATLIFDVEMIEISKQASSGGTTDPGVAPAPEATAAP